MAGRTSVAPLRTRRPRRAGRGVAQRWPTLTFVARRLGFTVLALFVVSILVFLATQALPGDAAVARLGRNASPEALASFREYFHLDDPLAVQYRDWLLNLLGGNLGLSFSTGFEVGTLIGDRVLNSLVLLVLAGAIGLPLAAALGIYTAIRRGRAGDHVASVALLVISALPEFVLGVLLVLLLATSVFPIFPAVSLLDSSGPIVEQLDVLVLPTLTLLLIILPYVARTMRACTIEALQSEYVTLARLKGLPEHRVVLRHVLPNIAGPTLQVVAQSLAYLAGGIVVVEAVFQAPGVGAAFVSAVQSRDIPVIQALAMLLAGFYVLVNILADVGTVAMTPTLRKGAR